MSVRHGKRPWNDASTLIEGSLSTDAVAEIMKPVQIRANPIAIGVKPRTGTDPLPSVAGVITLGTQLRTPGQMPLINAFSQVLTDLIRPL